ncbi:MAG: segregation/condensation protein A, partial [Terracidiphilus sp.]
MSPNSPNPETVAVEEIPHTEAPAQSQPEPPAEDSMEAVADNEAGGESGAESGGESGAEAVAESVALAVNASADESISAPAISSEREPSASSGQAFSRGEDAIASTGASQVVGELEVVEGVGISPNINSAESSGALAPEGSIGRDSPPAPISSAACLASEEQSSSNPLEITPEARTVAVESTPDSTATSETDAEMTLPEIASAASLSADDATAAEQTEIHAPAIESEAECAAVAVESTPASTATSVMTAEMTLPEIAPAESSPADDATAAEQTEIHAPAIESEAECAAVAVELADAGVEQPVEDLPAAEPAQESAAAAEEQLDTALPSAPAAADEPAPGDALPADPAPTEPATQAPLFPEPAAEVKAAVKPPFKPHPDDEQSPFSVIVAEVYDGPLDLLLDLIRKQDIDIYDIPIAKITAQFLAYVSRLRASDMDVAGEFIYTASLLIHIKSKMLLPRTPLGPDDAAEDPRRELVERLLEHERFKNAAQMLQQKQMLEAATWTNPGLREFR